MPSTKSKNNVDTITLFMGHNIIMGNKPPVVGLDVVNKIMEEGEQDLEKFGLFDSATPNYANYYPDVTAEDLKPKDEDFIYPVYRALSNTVVHAQYNPIEFPQESLKRAMYKLMGQSVMIDHERALGNIIGSISKAEWQEGYTTKGVKVPPGINVELKIDGKSNPRIARGVMMTPPSIHSTSVTVSFSWKKSHPEISDEEFWNKIGSFDKEGKLIRRVVSDIIAFHEISLVSHGADTFAQKVGEDGKIVNPQYAKDNYPISEKNLSAEKQSSKEFYFDFKEMAIESFSAEENTIPEELNNIQTNTEMDFLELLSRIFGTEITEENAEAHLKALQEQVTNLVNPTEIEVGGFRGVEAITTELERLNTEVTSLNNTILAQKPQVELNNILVGSIREDALRLYRLSLDGKTEDENIVNLINTSPYETLKSLHTQYDSLTDKQFQFHCEDCGSLKVSRLSSKPTEGDGTKPSNSDTEMVRKFTSIPNKVNTKFLE